MKNLQLNIFLMALMLAGCNLSDPDSYEDCVLKNIKNAKSEQATGIVIKMCREKFPTQEQVDKEAKQKKCQLPKDAWKFNYFFDSQFGNLEFTKNVISNIKRTERNYSYLRFQNNNSFPIAGLRLGYTKSDQCSFDITQYETTEYCSNDTGVSQQTFGTIQCNALENFNKKLNMCVIGYMPKYDKFDDSLLEFMSSNGYCN